MWKTKKNNLICSYLEAYENQKKHIERVLSAKDITKSTIAPYYPKFLKLKVCKHHMEEDKNDKIKEENKILSLKIMNAEEKPSQYSKIYKPKKCPAFDKEILYLKRMKKEIKNYEENTRFYNKIENIHSYYNNNELKQRKKSLDQNFRLLQKSIFDISPSLLFLSPSRIKKEIDKYKEHNMKKNNSSFIKGRPKSGIYTRHHSSQKSRKIEDNKSVDKNQISYNDGFLGPIQEEYEEKIKGNDNENEEKYKNIKKDSKLNNSYINKSKQGNYSQDNNQSSKSNKSNKKKTNKKQRAKSALRRNESEVNLLN